MKKVNQSARGNLISCSVSRRNGKGMSKNSNKEVTGTGSLSRSIESLLLTRVPFHVMKDIGESTSPACINNMLAERRGIVFILQPQLVFLLLAGFSIRFCIIFFPRLQNKFMVQNGIYIPRKRGKEQRYMGVNQTQSFLLFIWRAMLFYQIHFIWEEAKFC